MGYMRIFLFVLSGLVITSCATMRNGSNDIDQVVEASCGICQLSMAGDECQLAIRVDGKDYYVEGSSLDDHGNPHAEDGMCNAVRQAHVKGTLKHGIYVVTTFELVKADSLK
jgi:predicted small secreted protein